MKSRVLKPLLGKKKPTKTNTKPAPRMKSPPSYENLHLLPYLIAETIALQPYTGEEISLQLRNAAHVAEREAQRQALTPAQVTEFAQWCDNRCREAYRSNTQWFVKIVKSKHNQGRNDLYAILAHWLAAYLKNPIITNRLD